VRGFASSDRYLSGHFLFNDEKTSRLGEVGSVSPVDHEGAAGADTAVLRKTPLCMVARLAALLLNRRSTTFSFDCDGGSLFYIGHGPLSLYLPTRKHIRAGNSISLLQMSFARGEQGADFLDSALAHDGVCRGTYPVGKVSALQRCEAFPHLGRFNVRGESLV